MNINANTSTIVLVSLLIAAGAYWYFFTGTGDEPSLTSSVVTLNEAQTEFQLLVSMLQPISFETGLFSDPRFLALSDLSTPITPESAGRVDPFAAIGVNGK